MIIPDWQNPHCGTSSAAQAFCTGCEPSFDSPSMVTIFCLAGRFAVDVDGARAARGDAATVLGAGQPELLPKHPQQRSIVLRLEFTQCSIDVQLRHAPCLHFVLDIFIVQSPA
jgi:hypothetical protein